LSCTCGRGEISFGPEKKNPAQPLLSGHQMAPEDSSFGHATSTEFVSSCSMLPRSSPREENRDEYQQLINNREAERR
jgi:hypothetical protein